MSYDYGTAELRTRVVVTQKRLKPPALLTVPRRMQPRKLQCCI